MYPPYNQPAKSTFLEKLNSHVKQHERFILNAYMALIGTLGMFAAAKLINKLNKKNRSTRVSEPYDEPLDLTVEPLGDTVEITVHEPLTQQYKTVNEPLETVDDEKEHIRQAMSLLGKRSGAARRAKKREDIKD